MITNLPKYITTMLHSPAEYTLTTSGQYITVLSQQTEKDMLESGLTLLDVFRTKSGAFHHVYTGDLINGIFEGFVVLIEDSEKED